MIEIKEKITSEERIEQLKEIIWFNNLKGKPFTKKRIMIAIDKAIRTKITEGVN